MEQVYSTIVFYWSNKGTKSEYIAHNRTLSDALDVAKDFGYKPKTWYDPRTWGNSYTTYIRIDKK
jgi:hypothetical protein